MSAPPIRVSSSGEVTVVTLDRPPANALDPTLLAAGAALVEELTADPPPAVVLTGAGAFFSGGADLRVVPSLEPDAQAELTRTFNAMFAGWYQFPRPVVAAVNGHAVAGGLVLALCADHRVVGGSGRFGLTEVKVGIPFPSVAMAIVHGELTPPAARRLVLRPGLFHSNEAMEIDLFDERVDDGQVLRRAIDVAHELAALPSATYGLVKRQLRAAAVERRTPMFGGAGAAEAAVAEARSVAANVLDRRSE